MLPVELLTQRVALVAGAQFFMAGALHVFWSDAVRKSNFTARSC